LRFKTGKNLSFESKNIFEIKNPSDAFLPKNNLSSNYIFATNTDFFVYPNNINEYIHRYTDTFQHGGISMEEMIIPFVTMEAK